MKHTRLTGKQCLCRGCGERFSTEANFQRHRKGAHGVNRHCVSPLEVGLCKSEQGFWKLPGGNWREKG